MALTHPILNKRTLDEAYGITLPVYVWVQIGEAIRHIDDNTATVLPASVTMLVNEINDMVFPKSFQQSEKARAEKARSEHASSHPLMQLLGNMPGVELINPGEFDPDDFQGDEPA